MKNLTNIEKVALKAIKDKDAKEARENIFPGEYNVNFTVSVSGKVKVADDTEATPTASLMSVEFLLLALHYAGADNKKAMSAINKVSKKYLIDWSGTEEEKKAAKAAREKKIKSIDPYGKTMEIFDKFKNKLPKIPRAGRVSIKDVTLEVVQTSQTSQTSKTSKISKKKVSNA